MFRLATILVLLTLCGCTTKAITNSPDASPQPIAATVVAYEPNAEWDHFDDSSFTTYDKLTLRLDSPVKNETESLSISVSPTELSDDSPFRIPGTRITFTLDNPITPDVNLAWGALNNPTVAR